MTFNKELFLELCRKYDVQFSKEYTKIMIEEDGCIRELCPEDIERIFMPPKEIFSYDGVGYDDIRMNTHILPSSLTETPLLADKFLIAA